MHGIWVVGDIHGDINSLDQVLKIWNPDREMIVLIGDYADRGNQGVEVMQRALQLLNRYPHRIVALRGNHELYSNDGEPTFKPCHLVDEANRTYAGGWPAFFANVYTPLSQQLYLSALIPNETLFVHGGVSTRIKNVGSLEQPDAGVIEDVLTSDATIRFADERRNTWRRSGLWFGPTISKRVCERLNVKRVIRGHNHDQARTGPHIQHDGRIVTVLTTKYCSQRPYAIMLDPTDWSTATSVRLGDGRREKINLCSDTEIPDPFAKKSRPASVFDAAKQRTPKPAVPSQSSLG